MNVLWILIAVCALLVAFIAFMNLGMFVLCLRSNQPVAYVPLVVSILGVIGVFGLRHVTTLDFPWTSLIVLPLVLLAQRYGGQRVPQLTSNN